MGRVGPRRTKALVTGLEARAFALQVRFVLSFSGFLGDFGLVGRLEWERLVLDGVILLDWVEERWACDSRGVFAWVVCVRPAGDHKVGDSIRAAGPSLVLMRR